MQPEVLDEGKRPTGYERIRRLLPADIGIDPVHRGRREDGPKMLTGKPRVLKSGIHDLKLARAPKSLPGEPCQLSARLDRRYAQAPSQEATCQLSGSTTDLEHPIPAVEPDELKGATDQLLRVGWAVPVVLTRHLIEDPAAAALQCSVGHAHKVCGAADGAATRLGVPRSYALPYNAR